MRRPKFFEDLDKSLAGLLVDELQEAPKDQGGRVIDAQQARAMIAVNMDQYVAQATSLASSSVTVWPYERGRR